MTNSNGNGTTEDHVGFFNCHLGGTGSDAMGPLDTVYREDGEPYDKVTMQLDTDRTRSRFADEFISIPLNGDIIDAIDKLVSARS